MDILSEGFKGKTERRSAEPECTKFNMRGIGEICDFPQTL
jgi:hypothetical protein